MYSNVGVKLGYLHGKRYKIFVCLLIRLYDLERARKISNYWLWSPMRVKRQNKAEALPLELEIRTDEERDKN